MQETSGLSQLWGYAREHTPRLLVAAAVAIVGILATLAFPLVTKWLLDAVGAGASIRDPLVGLVVLFVVSAALAWFQQVIVGRVAEDIVADSRTRLLSTIFRARLLPLLGWSSGELATRLTSDTGELRDSSAGSLLGVVTAALLTIGTAVVMAFLDWPLLLVSLAAIVVVVSVAGLTMPLIASSRKKAQAATGELGARFTSAVRAVKTVKASSAEDHILGQLARFVEEARLNGVRAVKRLALATTLSALGIQAGLLIVLAYGGLRVATGALETSTLVAFLLYFFGLISPILELTSSLGSIQTGLASAERLGEVEQLPQESLPDSDQVAGQPDNQQVKLASSDLSVELDDVVAGYDADAPTLRNVSLHLAGRGHYALVGLSGAGKSTLFNVLLGFMVPITGSIRINGRDYTELRLQKMRQQFALVEQDTPLLRTSVRENLTLGNRDATDEELWDSLRDIGLHERISDLPEGLDTEIEGTGLSGGERQRLALARALLLKRPILLLDEVTAQLDGLTEQLVTNAVRKHAQSGMVLSIAHRLSTVMDADRIFLISEGEILDAGTHQELMNSSDLYRSFVHALRIEGNEQPLPEGIL